jgi:hypothetical protein
VTFKLFDRVKVNTSTTGTGDVTFGSVVSNAFLTPAEAGASDGDTTRYVIVDGTDYEEGVGTIKSSVGAMERTTVTKSKISGTAGTTKLNLSGTAVIAVPGSAQDILIPVNNLADLPDADEALDNLGGTTVGKALFTATDAAAARTAVGVGTDAAASKSEQQTGTETTRAVTPARQQDHDSALKAWIHMTQSGGTYTTVGSYNAFASKTSTGVISITWGTSFADANYAVVAMLNQTTGGTTISENYTSRSASSCQLQIRSASNTNVDSSFTVVAMGRQ